MKRAQGNHKVGDAEARYLRLLRMDAVLFHMHELLEAMGLEHENNDTTKARRRVARQMATCQNSAYVQMAQGLEEIT